MTTKTKKIPLKEESLKDIIGGFGVGGSIGGAGNAPANSGAKGKDFLAFSKQLAGVGFPIKKDKRFNINGLLGSLAKVAKSDPALLTSIRGVVSKKLGKKNLANFDKTLSKL